MDQQRIEDQYPVIDRTIRNTYLSTPGYELVQHYLDENEETRTILNAACAVGLQIEKIFKFGIEVPRNPEHALKIDKDNGTNG